MSLIDKCRGLFAGKPKGPAQRAGEKIDRAAEKVSASTKAVAAKAGDKIIEVGQKLKDAND